MKGIVLKGPDYYLSYFELKRVAKAYNDKIERVSKKLVLVNDGQYFDRLGLSKYLFEVKIIEEPDRFYLDKPINPIIIKEQNYNISNRIKMDFKGEKWVIVKSDKVYAGPLLKINRIPKERLPHNKPCFHPSSIIPTLAKVLINLTGLKEGTIYDPFCGIGGILIEAALMGFQVKGSDIDEKMLECAKQNLLYYGIKEFELAKCDARDLCLDGDAIVTDPPYGRYSKVYGNILELYKGFLSKAIEKNINIVSMLYPEFLNPELFVPKGYKILLDRPWVSPGIRRHFLLLERRNKNE
ncbi:NEQ440 [Nanoarchaeum equitans Kin4-M]|uniref:NEQ440 n=1 Tax=Nanoarchaeum equitans (strain Kin4-M) TaxID=228908 RepID=Q74M74_NANEQ|nr:NEQ440 [Nanoarchaeum equitans Kin4-M]